MPNKRRLTEITTTSKTVPLSKGSLHFLSKIKHSILNHIAQNEAQIILFCMHSGALWQMEGP